MGGGVGVGQPDTWGSELWGLSVAQMVGMPLCPQVTVSITLTP